MFQSRLLIKKTFFDKETGSVSFISFKSEDTLNGYFVWMVVEITSFHYRLNRDTELA